MLTIQCLSGAFRGRPNNAMRGRERAVHDHVADVEPGFGNVAASLGLDSSAVRGIEAEPTGRRTRCGPFV